MDTIKVGDVEIIAVSDGYGDMDPLNVFIDSSVEDWSLYPDLTDDEGHIHPRFGTTVIKVSGKTILVDTIFVYFSVLLGFFILEQFNLKTKVLTDAPVFVD